MVVEQGLSPNLNELVSKARGHVTMWPQHARPGDVNGDEGDSNVWTACLDTESSW